MAPAASPGLQADRDPRFVLRAAAVARAARWALAAVVALAALGVFGGAGPLVQTETVGPDGFVVRYDRFARLDAPVAVVVRLPAGADALVFEGDFVSALQVEAITPAPEAEAVEDGRLRYAVAVAEGGPVTVIARPLRFGLLRGAVVAGERRVEVQTLVYP